MTVQLYDSTINTQYTDIALNSFQSAAVDREQPT